MLGIHFVSILSMLKKKNIKQLLCAETVRKLISYDVLVLGSFPKRHALEKIVPKTLLFKVAKSSSIGLRAEEKGSEVIDVVFSNPKVAKYDIVPSTK